MRHVSLNEARDVVEPAHSEPVDTQPQLSLLERLLGPRRFKIAYLHLGQELTQAEVALKLGISQQTVSAELQQIDRIRQANFQTPSLN